MLHVFDDFPIPPTTNHLYATFRGRRVPSKEYAQFKRATKVWAKDRDVQLKVARDFCYSYITKGYWIQFSLFICLKHERIWTKDGSVKSLDGSNRIKATHDLMSDLLQIDDRFFAVGSTEKVLAKDEEKSIIILKPVKIINEDNIIEELLKLPKSTDRSILNV